VLLRTIRWLLRSHGRICGQQTLATNVCTRPAAFCINSLRRLSFL